MSRAKTEMANKKQNIELVTQFMSNLKSQKQSKTTSTFISYGKLLISLNQMELLHKDLKTGLHLPEKAEALIGAFTGKLATTLTSSFEFSPERKREIINKISFNANIVEIRKSLRELAFNPELTLDIKRQLHHFIYDDNMNSVFKEAEEYPKRRGAFFCKYPDLFYNYVGLLKSMDNYVESLPDEDYFPEHIVDLMRELSSELANYIDHKATTNDDKLREMCMQPINEYMNKILKDEHVSDSIKKQLDNLKDMFYGDGHTIDPNLINPNQTYRG